MFTGIIEEIGSIKKIFTKPAGAVITIEAEGIFDDLKVGDSLSVDGVCLTITKIERPELQADVSRETLNKTTLGSWRPGYQVNLERALTPTSRMGGHIVQGHVDATGTVKKKLQDGAGCTLYLEVPVGLTRYLVEKGSIAINGVSLTIAEIWGSIFSIAVIPHTLERTNLRWLKPGDAVNVEADIIAKYIYRYLGEEEKGKGDERNLMDLLEKGGYL